MMVIMGCTAMLIAIALLAYGREEVDHGQPHKVIYKPDWNIITTPSAQDAFLSVSYIMYTPVVSNHCKII